MSGRLNLGVGIGTFAVMLIMSFGVLYFTNQGKEQAEHNNRDIEELNKIMSDFIDRWDKRVETSNKVNNGTQLKISDAVNEILGNLSSHRAVTNQTLEKLTGLITQLNTTNEESRDRAVHNIVNNITEVIKEYQMKDGPKRSQVK